MTSLKNSRTQSRLEKIAREHGSGWVNYEAEAEAVRKKTARLKALRLAKEAAAPEVLLGSIIVDGDPPVWPGSIVVHNAKDARRVVDEIKESGADFVKIYNGIPRDAYFALVDESRKQNIPFAGHLPFEIRASEASDAGQRSIEHLTGIAIACSSREQDLIKQLRPLRYFENLNAAVEAIRSFDSARCQDLFAQFRRNNTWQVPTLTVSLPTRALPT